MATFLPPNIEFPLPDAILQVSDANLDRVIFLCIHCATATFTEVTWGSFMKHVEIQARYLSGISQIKPRKLHEEAVVVGFIAESTYSFAVTLFAMLLLRWTPALISSRNSVEAVSQLMRSTEAHSLFVDENLQQSYSDLFDSTALAYRPITIRAGFDLEPAGAPADEAFPWSTYLAQLRKAETKEELQVESARPAVFIHTSGSTGHPKPVPRTHRNIVATANVTNRGCMPGDQRVMYTCLPAFHGGALNLLFSRLLGAGGILVVQERWQPISLSSVISHLQLLRGRLDEVALPPSLLEQLVEERDPRDIDALKAVTRVFWGSASLRKSAGDFLESQGINLMCWCGMSEVGLVSKMYYSNADRQDPGDWEYMTLFECFSYTFIPIEDDPFRFRLVVSAKEAAPSVINHQHPTGFMTPDAWERHPERGKSHYIKLAGRLDDVTVLSNGEKTDNKQLEHLLTSSSLISQAVIFGSGRALNGVIISPRSMLSQSSNQAATEYLDSVWLHIDTHVNRTIPRHSRLLRPLVIVASTDKPFIRSDKGTIKTQATIALYSKEIEEAYARIDDGVLGPSRSPFVPGAQVSEGDIATFVSALAESLLSRNIPVEADLFGLGLDSLTSTALRAYVSAALREADLPSNLPRDVIYTHPSARALSFYLHNLIGSGSTTAPAQAEPYDDIADMVRSLVNNLPEHLGCSRKPSGRAFAITGTTGSLGVSFLAYLLPHLNDYDCVFLLNRRHQHSSQYDRHKRAFTERLFDFSVLEQALAIKKAVFVDIEIGQLQFGLEDPLYDMLSSCITHIIHIAWPVNFSLTLSSLKPQLVGVRSIIDLALSSKFSTPPHITFISSIGVVWNYSGTEALLSETTHSTPQSCIPMGYAWAKHTAERILHEAALKREGLRVAIVRCGQLSGARSTGAWPRSEYMPRLLRASVVLGMIPNDLQDMHWIPIDDAAELLYLQVCNASFDTTTSVRQFNIENVRPLPWQAIVRTIGSSFHVTGVSSRRWLEVVRADKTSAAYPICDYLADQIMSGAIRHRPTLAMGETAKLGRDANICIGDELIKLYIMYACISDC